MFCTQCGTQYEGNACPACSAAPEVNIATPSAPNYSAPASTGELSSTLKLSGWWTRVGASLIDWLVLIPVGIVTAIIIGGVAGGTKPTMSITAEAINAAIQFFYLSLMWTRKDGQTVGAKALGIRVLNVDGSAVSNDVAYRRAAILILLDVAWTVAWPLRPLAGIVLLLDIFWPLWDPKHQTLHDKAAGTIVVKL